MADRLDPRRLRRDLAALRGAVDTQRTQRQRAVESAAAVTAQLQALDARIAALSTAGDRDGAAGLKQTRAALIDQRAKAQANVRAIDDRLREAVGRFRDLIDPCDADPVAPLLLLPVRLETRYTNDRTALRVRIFPDDVHVDSLDRGMTPAEQDAAQAYWTAVWRASADDAAAAWRQLQGQVGVDRAPWVALGSQPSNLAARANDASAVMPLACCPTHSLSSRSRTGRSRGPPEPRSRPRSSSVPCRPMVPSSSRSAMPA